MYIIIYDFGTSSVKTCLFEIDEGIKLVASSVAAYGLYISEDGSAEQDTVLVDENANAVRPPISPPLPPPGPSALDHTIIL